MAAVKTIGPQKKALSIRALADAGVPENAIRRTIIIEFGSDEAVFDALLPESYFIRGQLKKVRELGHEHL
jgi:hypothetical protein